MKARAITFLSGLLFALGLGISGMVRPAKVQAFLDFFGDWDPSLMFVMGGAIAVAFVPIQRALRRERPVLAEEFNLPTDSRIRMRLVVGSALFGIGWGLSGYCPGPAVLAQLTLRPGALVFGICMVAGLWLGQQMTRAWPRTGRGEEGSLSLDDSIAATRADG